jgi:hypothetical protein
MEEKPNIELTDRVIDFFSAALYSRKWTKFFAEFQEDKFKLEDILRGRKFGMMKTERTWFESKYENYLRSRKEDSTLYLTAEGRELQDIARYFLVQTTKQPLGLRLFDLIGNRPTKSSGVERTINIIHLIYSQPIREMRDLYEYVHHSAVRTGHRNIKTSYAGGRVKTIERTALGTFLYEKILLPMCAYAEAENKKDTALARCVGKQWPLGARVRKRPKTAKPATVSSHRVGLYVPDNAYSGMLIEKLQRTVFPNKPVDFRTHDYNLDTTAAQFNIVFFDADQVPVGNVATIANYVGRTKVKNGRTKIIALTDSSRKSELLSERGCDIVLQKDWLDDRNGFKEESDRFLERYAAKITSRNSSGLNGIIMGTEQFLI